MRPGGARRAWRKRSLAAQRTIRDARGVVLLEVIVALAILILGMAAVGMQVNVGLRIANNSEVATKAVMLARSKTAELDSGLMQLVPNEELEGDFGVMYPGWAWRMYIDTTDTPDLNMVTLQILYKPGVAFREQLTDYDLMTVVHTSYTLRATPATMDLQRDFGFTEDQLQEAADSIPIPNFDPTNIDPAMIGQLDPEMLAEILPKLMELLGSNAALLNSLPQAARDQVKQAMDQANKGGADGGQSDNADQGGGGLPNLPDLGGDSSQPPGGRGGRGGRRPGGNAGGGSNFGGNLGSGNTQNENPSGRRWTDPQGRDHGPGENGGRDANAGGRNPRPNGAAPQADSGSARSGGGNNRGPRFDNRPPNTSGSPNGMNRGLGPRPSGANGNAFGNRGNLVGGPGGRSGTGPQNGPRSAVGGANRTGGLSPPYQVPTEQDLYGRGPKR